MDITPRPCVNDSMVFLKVLLHNLFWITKDHLFWSLFGVLNLGGLGHWLKCEGWGIPPPFPFSHCYCQSRSLSSSLSWLNILLDLTLIYRLIPHLPEWLKPRLIFREKSVLFVKENSSPCSLGLSGTNNLFFSGFP